MAPLPTATGQTAHSCAQFLNTFLSQRGPSALPYEEDVKWLTRQHLVSVIQEFPSLQVKTAMFTHNDGRTVNLLQAEGTIPMLYQEVTYNIPVTIWLLESYSRNPPRVYVTPTKDMIVKRGHPYVDASGLVSSPYLQGWVFPSSNLVDMVKNLSLLFGQDPPLYTKHSTHRNHSSGVVVSHTHMPYSPSVNPDRNSQTSPARPPSLRGNPPYPRFPQFPQRPPHMDDPSIVFKGNALNRLVELLHNDMVELRKSREVEMDVLFNTQAALRQREEQLDKGLGEMHREKEGLEQQLQLILTNTDVLETWLGQNGNKKFIFDIDGVFEPCDALSKQMLQCTAADQAIEDIVYSLDKAVQEGVIPFDAYLKNVRALSRDQFFHRATSAKVKAAQMQLQVASMTARDGPLYIMTSAEKRWLEL